MIIIIEKKIRWLDVDYYNRKENKMLDVGYYNRKENKMNRCADYYSNYMLKWFGMSMI